jgi:hypothetical protein
MEPGRTWQGTLDTAAGGVDPMQTTRDTKELNSRLEGIAWGLFLVMAGGFLLVPETQLPQGIWPIGIGVIMLGLNAVRLALGVPISWVTIVLGTLAILGGLSEFAGVDLDLGAIILIILGAALVVKAITRR